jgi:hypothetical protein
VLSRLSFGLKFAVHSVRGTYGPWHAGRATDVIRFNIGRQAIHDECCWQLVVPFEKKVTSDPECCTANLTAHVRSERTRNEARVRGKQCLHISNSLSYPLPDKAVCRHAAIIGLVVHKVDDELNTILLGCYNKSIKALEAIRAGVDSC